MSATEIAEILSEPVGTIKTRLRRAKQLLTEVVSEIGRTPTLVSASLAELELWAAAIGEQLDDLTPSPGS
jgi:RNA polymerase sigma-70 factor (ECF subfamily)